MCRLSSTPYHQEREIERESLCACVNVCDTIRERESGCVCECVCDTIREREIYRERDRERKSVCVCVWYNTREIESESLCACVSDSVLEREREREHIRVKSWCGQRLSHVKDLWGIACPYWQRLPFYVLPVLHLSMLFTTTAFTALCLNQKKTVGISHQCPFSSCLCSPSMIWFFFSFRLRLLSVPSATFAWRWVWRLANAHCRNVIPPPMIFACCFFAISYIPCMLSSPPVVITLLKRAQCHYSAWRLIFGTLFKTYAALYFVSIWIAFFPHPHFCHAGITAENIAKQYNLSREEQVTKNNRCSCPFTLDCIANGYA